MMATITQRRAATIDGEKYYTGDIPVYIPGSHTLKSDYIYECVENNFYSTSLNEAIERFGRNNIVQIHRDLPGSPTARYRRLLAKKKKCPVDDFLAAQVEFYIPLPEKLDTVKEKLA